MRGVKRVALQGNMDLGTVCARQDRRRSSDYLLVSVRGEELCDKQRTWHPSGLLPPEHAGAFGEQCATFCAVSQLRVDGSHASLRAQRIELASIGFAAKIGWTKDPPAFIGGADVVLAGGEVTRAAMVLLKYPSLELLVESTG